MKKLLLYIIILLSFVSCNFKSNMLGPMDFENFKRAIENFSTSPNYVVVKIKSKDGVEKIICTEAPFLQEAIHKDNDLPYDENGIKKVNTLLLNTFQNGIYIKTPEALDKVGFPDYDINYYKKQRHLALSKLNTILTDEGMMRFATSNFKEQRYQAHFLIDNGFKIRRGCYSPQLYIDE